MGATLATALAAVPEPANMPALECAVHQMAFRYGSEKIAFNAQALHDALNLDTLCAGDLLTAGQRQQNQKIIRSKLPFAEARQRLTTTPSIGASTFYVAVDGNDANPGTADEPFGTLAGARDAIRARRLRSVAQNATVYVRAGKYLLNATFELDSRDNNTAWRAYPGEVVTLSGGVEVDAAQFRPSHDAVLVAEGVRFPASSTGASRTEKFGPPPGTVNQLFRDGRRLVRARFPNGDPQAASGLCFSKSQRPGEACTSWLLPKAGGENQDSGVHVGTVKLDLNRGDSPTLGCPECTVGPQSFHYEIYDPPTGHPVYDTDAGRSAVPGWNNRSVLSMWGSIFGRPASFTVDPATWTKRAWRHPETAVVHMFHGALWGGWMFQVSGFDAANGTMRLGYGGFQEGRGASVSTTQSHYYVENVLEELDADGEWFYDEKEQKLYVQPNATAAAAAASASSVESGAATAGSAAAASSGAPYVAPILDTLVRVTGGASGVRLGGFRLTETRATFMSKYEVPSGGDWSVARVASVEVTGGASRVSIEGNLFDQVGGNGVLIGEGVRGSVVEGNEFVHSGDSAVVSIGAADGWDGTDAARFPRGNAVRRNHIHEYGVYGKQTSCYFQALTAASTVADNVCYNGPRAGINFNDGFFGAYNLTGNLLFNHVRETGDHGPFNSWDRQPYFTMNGVDDGFDPTTTKGYPPRIAKGASYLGARSHIARNFLINGYNGVWTIDHDDGSQFYNDTQNLMVFGGCKNFLGHSKSCDHNTILYPGIDSRSAGARRCQTDDNGVFAFQYFTANKCFEADGEFYTFSSCTSSNLATTVYQTRGNTFYADDNGTFAPPCGVDGGLAAWQALGQDVGSTVRTTPALDEIMRIANATLG